MATAIFDVEVQNVIAAAQSNAAQGTSKQVPVGQAQFNVPSPFPSPVDWRDTWIYFLMLDRFNNPAAAPNGSWDQKFNFRQGGTFAGVTQALDYLRELGVGAIWVTPILKNSAALWEFNYHGYGIQDFLNLDERFASDGTRATAEQEFQQLVDQAHARGMYIIVDIVLNHAGRVFDYVYKGHVTESFSDPEVLNGGLGSEPPIQWLNGLGFPRADWQDTIPEATLLSPDDAVFPVDLQRADFFRRRGSKASDVPNSQQLIPGDFGVFRQLVAEYDATPNALSDVRNTYGPRPVLDILIAIHEYMIAKYDIDGFRIDTAKYVQASTLETFGNAIREFAQTLGKRNFFTFGEIYDNESTIADFVGRNTADQDSYGIDAALDFPLFFKLPAIAKAQTDVNQLKGIFDFRKSKERELLSTHGEAGRFFVTFLDNHDQHERFHHPLTPVEQVTLGTAVLFCLQGIPALYYGTEAGLSGTVDGNGNPQLDSNESTREALWGQPNAFDTSGVLFSHIGSLSRLRALQPALRFGRLYFRQVAGLGVDFGFSQGVGGVIAFSRILSDQEVTLVANTNTEQAFSGLVLQDRNLNRPARTLRRAYSNRSPGTAAVSVQVLPNAQFWEAEQRVGSGEAAAIGVSVQPMEVQIFVSA